MEGARVLLSDKIITPATIAITIITFKAILLCSPKHPNISCHIFVDLSVNPTSQHMFVDSTCETYGRIKSIRIYL